MSQEAFADRAEFDRSYIGGIERGERNPSLTAIFRLALALEVLPDRLFADLAEDDAPANALDHIMATETESGLIIKFRYDQYDAEYELTDATKTEFEDVLNVLKKGLSSGKSKGDAVAQAFVRATQLWPNSNPSDLWTFVINRAYCDRLSHPVSGSRLNLEQSWKRTSGWALERVLLAHYGPFLEGKGIMIEISDRARKVSMLRSVKDSRVVPDKADVLISYSTDGVEKLLGVIHVKASIAERRTDDVPMSQALIEAGYLSVFWTMDCKSFPSAKPVNNGEFGGIDEGSISEKRQDFEEHGHFSACFSYNKNTVPTSDGSDAPTRIWVCDFTNPDDRFAQFLVDSLNQRLSQQPANASE